MPDDELPPDDNRTPDDERDDEQSADEQRRAFASDVLDVALNSDAWCLFFLAVNDDGSPAYCYLTPDITRVDHIVPRAYRRFRHETDPFRNGDYRSGDDD